MVADVIIKVQMIFFFCVSTLTFSLIAEVNWKYAARVLLQSTPFASDFDISRGIVPSSDPTRYIQWLKSDFGVRMESFEAEGGHKPAAYGALAQGPVLFIQQIPLREFSLPPTSFYCHTGLQVHQKIDRLTNTATSWGGYLMMKWKCFLIYKKKITQDTKENLHTLIPKPGPEAGEEKKRENGSRLDIHAILSFFFLNSWTLSSLRGVTRV